jgi:hypothetical protein
MTSPFLQERMYRLLQVSLLAISGVCAGCVPLPLHYYVPSAEGSRVESMSCSGGPPYGASSFGVSPRYHLLVSLEVSSLIVVINAEPAATIEFDPTLIRVEEGGLPIPIESVRYRKTIYISEAARDASSRIEANTGHLQIEATLKLGGRAEVDVHLPPITVNGITTSFPDVFFKFENHVRLTMIMGNC